MPASPEISSWTRHLVYRTECTRTTWKFRLGLLTLAVLALWLTRGWWTEAIASSLVCDASRAPSDAILVENFDLGKYLLFERAAELRRAGFASRVLVTQNDMSTPELNEVAAGTVKLMASVARTGTVEVIPTGGAEPITLNVARDVQRYLQREHIHSVIVVASLFRSRRSTLVYAATLGRAGIKVRLEPVQVTSGVNNWTRSWHGLQNVVEEWLKLQYYRFYVLPVLAHP